MKTRTHSASVLLLLILLFAVLSSQAATDKDKQATPGRSFHMGFTPFPYALTEEAYIKTFDFVAEHGDIICHHMDTGVPWLEALKNKDYNPRVMGEIAYRVSRLGETEKVYLALSPIALMRDKLAGYWGETTGMERTGVWANRDFDHPKVFKAYMNHCRYMIGRFQPDYFAYAIECNLLAQINPEGFDLFVKLARKVYRKLKREFPNLPVFATFALINEADFYAHKDAVERMLPFTDYLAMSTYPFLFGEFRGDPTNIPRDWFTNFRALAPEKPFALAETGYPAEDVVSLHQGTTLPGNPDWQAQYVKRLLRDCDSLDAEFVIWFFLVDYDKIWAEWIKEIEDDTVISTWRDCGLLDENLKPRKSLKIWDKWLKRPEN